MYNHVHFYAVFESCFCNNHMFCSKAGLSKFSSAPYLQARYEEKKDESVEAVESAPNFTSGFTNGGEVRHRHSFNSNYDTRRTSDSSLRETEQKSSGDSVSWGKGVGVSLDKTDSKSSKSPILGGSGISRGKSSSFRESSSPSKTPSRLVERSDSGSRSSTEFVRSHSRERSFEKSLENIMDRCSEKSLDMNVSLESKNGMVSDSSRVEDSSLSAAKKSADKSDKKKKNAPWYTVSIFVVILFLNFFFLYVASIICLASYNIFFQLHTRLSCTFTKFYAEKFGLKYLICKSIEIVFLSFIKNVCFSTLQASKVIMACFMFGKYICIVQFSV